MLVVQLVLLDAVGLVHFIGLAVGLERFMAQFQRLLLHLLVGFSLLKKQAAAPAIQVVRD